MLLMISIFFMELFFSALPNFLGVITNLVAKIVLRISNEESEYREEVRHLKEEQSQLSMTDNWVLYTRLQRKVDKLMVDIKKLGGIRQQKAAYLKMGITVGMYVLHGLMMIILLVYYRNEPLMYFPTDWVAPSPMSKLVAFPSGIHGALGFGCWVMVSNAVIRRGKGLLGA